MWEEKKGNHLVSSSRFSKFSCVYIKEEGNGKGTSEEAAPGLTADGIQKVERNFFCN